MLPLVFQTANADGFTDFEDGLVPNIFQEEDLSNLGVLGDPGEPLLAAAIREITGVPVPGTRTPANSMQIISESKASSPTYQVMVVDQ